MDIYYTRNNDRIDIAALFNNFQSDCALTRHYLGVIVSINIRHASVTRQFHCVFFCCSHVVP